MGSKSPKDTVERSKSNNVIPLLLWGPPQKRFGPLVMLL